MGQILPIFSEKGINASGIVKDMRPEQIFKILIRDPGRVNVVFTVF